MDQKIICDAEDLTAIADAVRTSTGSTNTYNVPELSAAAVNAIGTRVNIDETLTISGAAAMYCLLFMATTLRNTA